MKKTHLATLTRDEIRESAPHSLVVLPIAAIEQHGPHLPISTDTMIVTQVADTIARRLAPELKILVAPTLPYGISHHHKPHPGVMTVGTANMLGILEDLVGSLVGSGFRRIAILNGHGGNVDVMNIIAREMNYRHDVTITALDVWEFYEDPEGIVVGHAGKAETAVMMHLTPELVSATLPGPAEMVTKSRIDGVRVFQAGKRLGLGPGYGDDPSKATAALGEEIFEHLCERCSDFIRKVCALDDR
ncbi:creatininase family protein [Chelativorans xinjiangense]|uniref:creatininase family protein n=1 Tax=Chelativorans xinjiangense TaxID=2681485 RepID=UPI0013571E2C|nr:creatininase family protein [Chelativorans xinjiangense]